MSRGRTTEEAAEIDRFANQRLLHEINVPDETRQQRSEGQKDRHAVGPERRAVLGHVRHRASDERRPQAHQDSGDNAGDNALARDRAAGAGETSVGFSVEDYGYESASNAAREEHHVASGLQRVAQDDPDYQRDSN